MMHLNPMEALIPNGMQAIFDNNKKKKANMISEYVCKGHLFKRNK